MTNFSVCQIHFLGTVLFFLSSVLDLCDDIECAKHGISVVEYLYHLVRIVPFLFDDKIEVNKFCNIDNFEGTVKSYNDHNINTNIRINNMIAISIIKKNIIHHCKFPPLQVQCSFWFVNYFKNIWKVKTNIKFAKYKKCLEAGCCKIYERNASSRSPRSVCGRRCWRAALQSSRLAKRDHDNSRKRFRKISV